MNQKLLEELKEKKIFGFQLIEKHFIEELQCSMWLLRHESGAELAYMDAPSKDKCFALSFRLSPSDDTGVAHIIEHTILCGSQKYGVKNWGGDGLLCSFYSAFTMRDASMYPVSSENEASFQSLVQLYSDAVFAPLALESDHPMKQEGWHYEYDEEKDQLSYSGIVYSEMQASYEMPEFILADLQFHSAFTDTSLGYNVGGAPEAIPDLTYEQFLHDYHQIFNAQNCLVFVYGDTCLRDVLETVSPYLKPSKTAPPAILGQPTKADASGRPFCKRYPLPADADPQGKDYIGFNWVVVEGGRAAALRADLLCRLLQPRLNAIVPTDNLTLSSMTDTCWPVLSLVIRSADRLAFDTVKAAVQDAVRHCLKDGFSAEEVRNAITALSYQYNSSLGFVPDSVERGIKATTAWVHGQRPWENFEYEEFFREMQTERAQKDLLAFAENVFLDNPYFTSFILEACPGLAQERACRERDVLARRREAMTEEDISKIIADTKKLHKEQNAPEPAELAAKLPVIHISDLEEKAPLVYPEILHDRDRALLFLERDSNIVKTTLHYALPQLREGDMHLLGVFSLLFGKTGTTRHTAEEIRKLAERYTGGLKLFTEADDLENGTALRLQIQFDTLCGNFSEAQTLVSELIESLSGPSLKDRERIRKLLSQYLSACAASNPDLNGRAKAYYSPASAAREQYMGIAFRQYVEELLADYDTLSSALCAKLSELAERIFDQAALTVGFFCRRNHFDHLKEALAFPSKLQDRFSNRSVPLPAPGELFQGSGKMQFIAQSAPLGSCSGPMLAAAKVATNYASQQIRDVGGAYKVYVTVSHLGDLVFEAGRDPQLIKTLETFKTLPAHLASAGDAQIHSAVISAAASFAKFFRLDTGGLMACGGSAYDQAAANYFAGNTAEKQQALWDSLLSASPQQVRDCADLFNAALEKGYYCAVASKEKIESEGAYFNKIYR